MPARRRSLVVGLTVGLAVTTLTLAAPGAHASPCNALGPVGHDVGSTGSAASANGGAGIQVGSNANTIGGAASGQPNTIAGNTGAGVLVDTGQGGE